MQNWIEKTDQKSMDRIKREIKNRPLLAFLTGITLDHGIAICCTLLRLSLKLSAFGK